MHPRGQMPPYMDASNRVRARRGAAAGARGVRGWMMCTQDDHPCTHTQQLSCCAHIISPRAPQHDDVCCAHIIPRAARVDDHMMCDGIIMLCML